MAVFKGITKLNSVNFWSQHAIQSLSKAFSPRKTLHTLNLEEGEVQPVEPHFLILLSLQKQCANFGKHLIGLVTCSIYITSLKSHIKIFIILIQTPLLPSGNEIAQSSLQITIEINPHLSLKSLQIAKHGGELSS